MEYCMRRKLTPSLTASLALLLLLLLGMVAALGLQARPQAHSQTKVRSASPFSYLYYTLKDTRGFVVARARKGINGQPVGSPETLAVLGNEFGLVDSDNVATIQLSPDGKYVAIDGMRDHGEQVWVYDTQSMTVSLVPAHVMGNFLHWLPGGNGHSFLYRPMFPLGPDAPMDGINGWNPGLWVVDAATHAHTNIDIQVPSAYLIDAAASPDNSHIIYSTTNGLGMGSDAWLMNRDGSMRTHLLKSVGEAQSILGLFTWSPDGSQIAYERLSDSATPFLNAGLWVMDSHGGQSRHLVDTDGGHGFMPVWSPDSRKLAFIARTNVGDRRADQQAQALQCTIGVVDVQSSQSWHVVSAQQTGMMLNINPGWTPDSASITFTALNPINRVVGGTPRYWSARVVGPTTHPAATQLTPALSHVIAIG